MPSPPSGPMSPRVASHKWLFWWLGIITLLSVQRPVFSPNLWWHLSRGREVASGTFSPARSLLSLETASEADWAGGVPFYLLWSIGGIHALAAVPLLAALGLLGFVSRQRSGMSLAKLPWLLLPPLWWTLRDGLQPTPELFDLLGLLVLWCVLEASLTQSSRLLLTFLIFVGWASLGPQPIWGLLLIVVRVNFPQANSVSKSNSRKLPATATTSLDWLWLRLLGAALLGGMFTPRGPLGWRDSVMMLAPSAFGDLTPLAPPDLLASVSFCLLWCLWVTSNVRSARTHHDESTPLPLYILNWSIPLLGAWLSPANIPVCGLWMLLEFLHTANTVAEQKMPLRVPAFKIVAPVVATLLLGIVALDASGRGPTCNRRLGWGIAQELDLRLLDARLFSIPEETAIAWAPDGRSVGVVTWLDGNVRIADHPQRAFLGGRQQQHAALIRDLLGAHRARYRLDDGSWGGWVHQLAAWNVDMLVLPVEKQDLCRSLQSTPWTPADLDSPTIPFVSGEDLRFASVVLESLQQQDFVDTGPWQPTADIYAGQGWRIDVVELLGGGPDPGPAIRQSQLFRSQAIPMAALRALRPMRKLTDHPSLKAEFETCTTDLAYQEWLTSGQSSELRYRVLNVLRPNGHAVEPFLSSVSIEDSDAEAWDRFLEQYLHGQLASAISSLPLHTPQQHYAAALLWIELGDSNQALASLERVLTGEVSRPLQIAARHWKQQIQPLEQP